MSRTALREALWDEYRNYTGIDGGTINETSLQMHPSTIIWLSRP